MITAGSLSIGARGPGARDAGRSAISCEDFACAVIDELEAAQQLRQLVGTGH